MFGNYMDAVTSISTPLGVAGVSIVVLFALLRHMTPRNGIGKIEQKELVAIYHKIINGGFLLSWTAIILGGLGYMLRGDQIPPGKNEKTNSTSDVNAPSTPKTTADKETKFPEEKRSSESTSSEGQNADAKPSRERYKPTVDQSVGSTPSSHSVAHRPNPKDEPVKAVTLQDTLDELMSGRGSYGSRQGLATDVPEVTTVTLPADVPSKRNDPRWSTLNGKVVVWNARIGELNSPSSEDAYHMRFISDERAIDAFFSDAVSMQVIKHLSKGTTVRLRGKLTQSMYESFLRLSECRAWVLEN